MSLLILHCLIVSAQKYDNNWLLCSAPRLYNFNSDTIGYGGIDFYSLHIPASTQACRAIISDSAGNYEFLSNGYTLLNKDFQFMKGMIGKCLISPLDTLNIRIESGATSSGLAMILPRPEKKINTLFFISTMMVVILFLFGILCILP